MDWNTTIAESSEDKPSVFIPPVPQSITSFLYQPIELAYNIGPDDSEQIHPFCLCSDEYVITKKLNAPWAPKGFSVGSCPVEKCNRSPSMANADFKAQGKQFGNSINYAMDGCTGVILPPYAVNAPSDAVMPAQRSYGTYRSYSTANSVSCAKNPRHYL
jgi:hypothetical protein